MALVASSIPHSVRQASFSESSNDLRGGSTYATQNDEFADSRRASRQDSDLRAATEAKNDRLTLAAADPTFRDLEAAVSKARSLWGHACMTSDVENASRLKEEWSKATERANEYYETHCTSAIATA